MNTIRFSHWFLRASSILLLTAILSFNTGLSAPSAAHANGLAELHMVDFVYWPPSPYFNDDVKLQASVTNSGSTDSGSFFIDVYVDETPTGCSDWGSFYISSSRLAGLTSYAFIGVRAE